jgi:hypothetical protein
MSRRLRVTIVVIAVIVSTFVAGYAVAGRIGPNLVPPGSTRYGFVAAENAVSATNSSFVTMPSMAAPFTVPPNHVADAILTFSGELNTCSFILVRGTIDGVSTVPSSAQVAWNNKGGAESHGFTFYRKSVPAGNHTATIEWEDGGCSVQNNPGAFVSSRSLVLTLNVH